MKLFSRKSKGEEEFLYIHFSIQFISQIDRVPNLRFRTCSYVSNRENKATDTSEVPMSCELKLLKGIQQLINCGFLQRHTISLWRFTTLWPGCIEQLTISEGLYCSYPQFQSQGQTKTPARPGSYVPYSLRKVCGFFNVFSLPVMSRSSFSSSSEKTKTSSHLMQQDSAQQKRKAMIATRLPYVTLVKTYESKVHVNISILYRNELLPSSYW